MDLGIAGKSALVCASSRGLGRACAHALAAEGVRVVVNGRDPERLEVTGCPRYDYCSAPWSALLEYIERDFVLVNTNFSAINPQFSRSAEDEIEVFIRTGWPRDAGRQPGGSRDLLLQRRHGGTDGRLQKQCTRTARRAGR